MAASNGTRRASGARGGARARVPAVIHPGQLSCAAGLPHLDGDGAAGVRRFAESAFAACPASHLDAPAACADTPAPRDAPVPYEHYTPVFYTHDGSGFRLASPHQILQHAQHLVSRRFHRNGLLIDQPHVVRALLEVQLAAHPRVVFAALFIDRGLRLIDFVELFTGTTDQVVIYTREMVRVCRMRHRRIHAARRTMPNHSSSS